jgi:hypothetical protein
VDVDGGGIDLDAAEPAADAGGGARLRGTAKRSSEHDWRWVVGGLGRVLIILGVLVLGFVVYQLWGTGIQEARSQNKLEAQFNDIIATTPAPTTVPTTVTTVAASTPVATVPSTTTLPLSAAPPEKVKEGDPLARIEIPKIGVDKIVVAGVALSDLRKGLATIEHRAARADRQRRDRGHRTTYGAVLPRRRAGRGRRDHRDDRAGHVPVSRHRDQDREADRLQRARPDTRRDAHAHLVQPRYSSRQRIVVKAKLDTTASARRSRVRDHRPAGIPRQHASGDDTIGARDGRRGETVGGRAGADSALVSGSTRSAPAGSVTRAMVPTILWGARGPRRRGSGCSAPRNRWARTARHPLPLRPLLLLRERGSAPAPEHLSAAAHTIRRMPVDPEVRQILDLIDQMGFKLGGDITPQELRDQMGVMDAMAPPMPDVASSEWRTIAGVKCQVIKLAALAAHFRC